MTATIEQFVETYKQTKATVDWTATEKWLHHCLKWQGNQISGREL